MDTSEGHMVMTCPPFDWSAPRLARGACVQPSPGVYIMEREYAHLELNRLRPT